MWRNYLTVACRALARHKVYAFINIFGLALGLAACILILLYVRYETSYDRWLPNAGQIFQVQSIRTDPQTGEKDIQQYTQGIITQALPKDFPQIEEMARADEAQFVLLQAGEPAYADVLMAEAPLFRILQIPFLRGDRATALEKPNALVISRKEAVKRFGTVDALGRTVTRIARGEKSELEVTGVFEDLPPNSHFGPDLVTRITPEEMKECDWGCIIGFAYARLKPGASAEEINRRLPAWEKRNIPSSRVGDAVVNVGDHYDWRLVNVRDVHLSGAEGPRERPGNDRATLVTFTLVALLILGIAVCNFVNLATAGSSRRAREVAVRKVLGARRRQLILQFLGESLMVVAVSTLIALALVEVSLPWFAHWLGADLELKYFGADGVLLPVLGLLALVGVAGGVYPAFYLSRFQPAAVLKANRSSPETPGSGRLRTSLVVAQFAISIGLIVCTMIVYAQTSFMRSADAGYRRDGLIVVSNLNRAAVVPLTETLIREAARLPGVERAAGTSIVPASDETLMTRVRIPGRADPVRLGQYAVHPDFFATMGIRLLAGRQLSRRYANDNAYTPYEPEEVAERARRDLAARGINIVVNQRAAEEMGFGTPAGALGRQIGINTGEESALLPATIVGVAENSRFRSAREAIEPMIFFDRGIYSGMVVRYSSPTPKVVLESVERLWKRLAPDVPFEGDFADSKVADLYRTDAARGEAFAGFAVLAVAIACLGLFGLAAFAAERRTKEIGIRKVFGARVRDIVRLLAWQFSKPVVIANLVAWPVAWWVMRDWLNGFDARIALGPGPFLMAGLLALAIALGTIAGHAVKVARLNPIHALRYE
ncbi:MAG TPA: ABC transporter permease [Allosphingosinicella sp.]|jgi:putative ABC transport system permease protein